jgi:Tol biopolymer transport system component
VPVVLAEPTETRAPTDTPEPTQTPAPTDTPEPTPTATLEPPTAAPTVAGPPLGGGTGRIAFISNRDGLQFQVYTMNYDGTDVQQLTFDDNAKWSPEWTLGRLGPLALSGAFLAWNLDGSQLLYVAESAPGSSTLDLWVINADGSNPVNLTAPTRAGQVLGDDFHPAWCSDGTIAYTSIRNTSPQVFIMESIENRVQRNYSTARSNPIEYNPVFFPDCRRILLISTQNGDGELWRVFPSRGAQAQMWATFPSFPGANNENSYRVFLSELALQNVILDAAISPDGQYVAYTRRSAGGRDIVLTTVTDSQFTMRIQQVTNSRSDSQPQWSPDGKYIAFTSRRENNNEQVFRMLFTGNEQTNISNNEFRELSPAWQPTPLP